MNTKEKVLQKCAELRNPSAPWINEEWDLKRYVTTNRWELHRHKGMCDIRYQFSDDVPDDDPVWPLAAQALGILPTDLNKFVNDLLHVVGNHFQFDLLTTVKRLVDKSSKPDWVKEELADANKETIFRHLDLLESQLIATTSDDDRINEALEGMTTRLCMLRILIKQLFVANRPSDDLLWKAFSYGADNDAIEPLKELFAEFLKTLPPDTSKEDRELVRKSVLWDTGDIFEDQIELHMTAMAAPTIEVYEALKRLCGMEVGNG